MKKIIKTLLFVFILGNSFAFDQLTLLNNATFEGWVVKLDQKKIQFNFNDELFTIPLKDVHTVVFEDTSNILYQDYLNSLTDDKCTKATLDAEMYHGKKGGHFALGVIFGPFSMIGTALANPNPMNAKRTFAMSENKELFNDPEYLLCYKKAAKRKLIGMEALGWATWILIVIL
jgi:hypothetical protein